MRIFFTAHFINFFLQISKIESGVIGVSPNFSRGTISYKILTAGCESADANSVNFSRSSIQQSQL